MAEIKLTKHELRQQQTKLNQLQQYLPTLQLRKALLQAEVHAAHGIVEELTAEYRATKNGLTKAARLLQEDTWYALVQQAVAQVQAEPGVENIAGVLVPCVQACHIEPLEYDLYDTPAWLDALIREGQRLKSTALRLAAAHERARILSKELKDVFLRVNLFEKVLIPQCMRDIKTIKIFLGELELGAIAQAKIAKAKIAARLTTGEQDLS